MAARNRLPSPRTLAIAAAIVAPFAGLWLNGHAKRQEVERIAGDAASEVAGRPVAVNCPGPIQRRLLYEIHEGSVRFKPGGEPYDETNLSARTCDGLRDAIDAGASLKLDCLAYVCPADDELAAAALAILAHEAVHLRGVIDEGKTECEARTHIARVASHFELTPQATQQLARWQATDWADELPSRYQAC